jgi:serine protease inhibitor
MKHKLALALIAWLAIVPAAASGAPSEGDSAMAANVINALGLDLMRQATNANKNVVLSPYSIQLALAMTYAGADGATRREMAAVLHYPDNDAALNTSFGALRDALAAIARLTEDLAAKSREPGDPIVFTVANRLFGQTGYDFRAPFLDLLKNGYDAPLQLMDFTHDADHERIAINAWVAEQTQQKINDLIPPGALTERTRLVLTNAIYMKAPWASPFDKVETKSRRFHLADGTSVDVPTMRETSTFGFEQRDGYCVVAIPYVHDDIQLLILMPDAAAGLPALESTLTPEVLGGVATASQNRVGIELPKFKLEPPTLPLAKGLQALGMRTAFDIPEGSANFDRMAPRRPGDYLKIDQVFHKAFIDVNELGTEAAAATAVSMMQITSVHRPVEPIEVKIDRPFLFAIQHRASGACLFIGRVTDPR